MPIPTILYARQSLTRNGSESLPLQVKTGYETAARFDCEIVLELVEPPSTSGYKDRGRKRPMFQELLKHIRKGTGLAVVTYKSDRLSRGGGPGWAPLFEAFDAVGVDMDHAVLTPGGWMSEMEIGIRGAMDREESKKTSDRMRMVRRHEATSGKPHTGGNRPFGRMDDRMTPHPVEAPVIAEWYERVLTTGATMYSLAVEANDKGLTTVQGHRWTNRAVKLVLCSQRHAGIRIVDDTIIDGLWEPIVSVDEWLATKAILNRHPRRGRPVNHLLGGFLRCGKCRFRMAAGDRTRASQTPRIGVKDAAWEKDRARVYKCPAKGCGGCGGVQVAAWRVEADVRKYVTAWLWAERENYVADTVKVRPDALGIQKSITVLNSQRQRLLDLYQTGDLEMAEYRLRKGLIDTEIVALEAKLSPLTNVIGALPLDLAGIEKYYDDATTDLKRMLIGMVLESVVVRPASTLGNRWDPKRLDWNPR